MGSYSRTGYLAIKKETSENVAVTPDVFLGINSEDLMTEWGGIFSQAVTNDRSLNYRPIDRAIPAPSGTITLDVEPNTWGHFMLASAGAISTGVYIPITSASGDFTVGETITGGTSTETATVVKISSERDYVLVSSPSGEFTDGETITGGTSSTTATLTKFDAQAIGHEVLVPQNSLDTTYTIEIGRDNEAVRYTGVRFHNITYNQVENVITAQVSVSARASFYMGRVTEAESSGAGAHTVLLDQTTGLVASDTIKVYRPGTGFLDFSASGVKTHTIGTVASETSITFTNLQTALAVGDLIVLAPQTPSYSLEKEFIWAGGSTVKIASTITTALSATEDNIEDFELTIENNLVPKHTASGANVVNRFPGVVFTAGLNGTGTLMRTYTDVTYMDKMRSTRQFGMQILMEGGALPNAVDFKYTLDFRIPDGRHNPFNTNIAEDDLLNQDMPFQMFNSTSDGYLFKALLVNEETAY